MMPSEVVAEEEPVSVVPYTYPRSVRGLGRQVAVGRQVAEVQP